MHVPALLVMALAATAPGRSPRETAVADAVRLWAEIRYRHPAVARGEVDWDAALVDTVSALSKTAAPEELDRALEAMVARLGDPGTVLVRGDAAAPPSFQTLETRWVGASTLIVNLRPLDSYRSLEKEVERLGPELDRARRLVLDLRGQPPLWTDRSYDVTDALEALAPWLASTELAIPPAAALQRQGFAGAMATSGGYETRWALSVPAAIAPRKGEPRRVVAVVDPSVMVEPLLVGLQRSGRGAIVSVGLTRAGVNGVLMLQPSPRQRLSLAPRIVLAGKWSADTQLPADQGSRATDAALELLDRPAPARTSVPSAGELLHPEPPDRDYADLHPPGPGHRVLALARIWATIRFFYPYLELLKTDWNRALDAAVPAFLAADSDERYARAVLALANQVTDSHTVLRGPAVDALLPRGWIPAGLLPLDEGLTVATVGPASGALQPGDVVRTVDGEDVRVRARRMAELCTASTPAGHRFRSLLLALRGAPGTTAQLGVWNGKALRTVEVQRVPWPQGDPETSPAFRVLKDGTGYVDLTSLEVADVPRMISALGEAPAIVFDMRGYPRGTAWSIAPWLDRRHLEAAASFREPWLVGDKEGTVEYRSDQKLGPADRAPFRGKVAMLIDERAVSQSEHTGLLFERATNLLLVGSPTAGANGDVTALALPGGLTFFFTGHDIRHADGRQLQRVGLRPDVSVRPTAAGLRAGRDEVLERALQALRARGGKARSRAR